MTDCVTRLKAYGLNNKDLKPSNSNQRLVDMYRLIVRDISLTVILLSGCNYSGFVIKQNQELRENLRSAY